MAVINDHIEQFIGSVATLMEISVTCALVFLLAFGVACCVDGRQEASNADTSKGDAGQKRPSRTTENKPSRCSYTFIVPQQKLTGALCVSTEAAHVNRSETASLRALLDRQQKQLDTMRGQLEQEGALANEMRVLRRESVNMNARITQLYAQLLNEILQKKDQALEQRRLENLVLNATAQAECGEWQRIRHAVSCRTALDKKSRGSVFVKLEWLLCTVGVICGSVLWHKYQNSIQILSPSLTSQRERKRLSELDRKHEPL
ncbi:hypothetical protein G5714_005305 [Onychostoma macrolepis]|uniref:Uncharacterized protein n=1 Tax=Onychostoma macrolepis TaxID=369639 RepID=A0A7J6D0N4_9TELE|nr:hypothetical protein G5714_005305 [Onychostoma macrolepis]